MRYLLLMAIASVLIPASAGGQEIPKATKEGKMALQKLVEACVADGGLKPTEGPKGKQLTVADEDKLRATVAAHPELLTPALRDALVAGWDGGDEAVRPGYLGLLRAYGREKKDELALAFAAFLPGWRAQQQRQYPVALGFYKEAEQHFGTAKEPAWQATTLDNIGRVYDDLGEYGQALDYLQRALAMRRKLYPEPHPDIALSLNNIGLVYDHQGEYGRALDHYQRALAMFQKLYDGPHPYIAGSLSNIGAVYEARGEYGKALDYLQRGLAMTQKLYPEPHPDIATSLNNIGFVYSDQGEYGQALDYLQRALAMRQKLYPEPDPGIALSLNNIGAVYHAQGEYGRALDYHQRALAMYQKVYPGPHPGIATSLNDIGAVYQARGEYAKALDYLQRALAMRQKLWDGPHPAVAVSLNNIGAVYHVQGEYGRALDHYQRALAMFQKLYDGPHPDIATSLSNIGLFYDDRGEYGRALDYVQRALAMQRKLYHGPHPDIAQSLNNIGGVYHDQGEYGQALDYHEQALAIKQKLYPGPHPDIALSLSNIGRAYQDQGEHSKALHSWDEALQVLRLAPSAEPLPFDRLQASDLRPLPMTVNTLTWRGLASEKALPRNPTAAELRGCERSYALASDLLDRVRHETIKGEADQLRHGAEMSELTPRRVGICRRLFELTGDPAELAAAFRAAEQGRARVFLEELAASRAGLLGGVSPELRDQEAALLRRLREYDLRIEKEESNPGKGDTPLSKLWEGRQQTEADLLKLVTEMEKQFPRYAALKYPKPCSVEEARACLDPNEVALHFVLGKEESYALLLEAKPAPGDKAQRLAIYVLPGRDAIADGVTALADADTLTLPARVRGLGAELYAKLLAPLAGRLRGKDLVIVPDGPLGYLPFELLVEETDGGGRFLVEGHRIRYAPSLTALHLGRLWAKQREQLPDRLLWALGDPVYGAEDERLTGKPALAAASRDAGRELAWREGQGTERFARLRYSGREVDKIRERLGETTRRVVTGKDATEAAVRRASADGDLARARYVHFACHGILGLNDGQPPALVLSLVGNSGERDEFGVLDGFLRLDEVTNLRLNADLVVLSACRSGQGRLYNGEGVHGLARAFLHAGSRGVVCSLWSVDDKETADFMAAFYGRLKDGRPAADALRDTRLEMIRAGKAPLYWAPFILIGE
jgi:CHAT domain-containing protein/tetratricopeptide (TPR) repeat protein